MEGPLLNVQRELRESSIDQVAEKYHLKYRRHLKYDNLVLFKYQQKESPFNEVVVQECRGIILDSSQNWKVVCFPYKKFFNFGEPNAHPIDWNTATVQDKLDGSLISLYWYKDEWHVASSGIPDGKAILHDSGKYFCDLFWEVWKNLKLKLPENKNCCYMFEMLTPQHVIIVRPEKDRIALHGARDLTTFKELDPVILAENYGWPIVDRFPFKSIDEVQEAAKAIDPIKAEGFVVCDANFNRVKVKAPQYVALAHLSVYDAKGLNFKNMVQIIQSNEGTEFLTYFPKYQELFNLALAAHQRLIDNLQKSFNRTMQVLSSKFGDNISEQDFKYEFKSNIEVPKELREDYFSIAKNAFDNKITISEALSKMELDKLSPLVKHQLSQEEKLLIASMTEKKERRAPGKGKRKNRQQRMEEKEQKKQQYLEDQEKDEIEYQQKQQNKNKQQNQRNKQQGREQAQNQTQKNQKKGKK